MGCCPKRMEKSAQIKQEEGRCRSLTQEFKKREQKLKELEKELQQANNEEYWKNLKTQVRYSADKLFEYLAKVLSQIAQPIIKQILIMYYVLIDGRTPLSHKIYITSALAYFISPLDIIPDTIPVVGFSDDIAIIGKAYLLIEASIRNEHRSKAQEKMNDLFKKNN